MRELYTDLIAAAFLMLTVTTVVSWWGFNIYYDMKSCTKYTEDGQRCIERNVCDDQ